MGKRMTETQIASTSKQLEARIPPKELYRKYDIASSTSYNEEV